MYINYANKIQGSNFITSKITFTYIMTEFRRNHSAGKGQRKRGFGGFIIRSVLFVIFLLVLMYMLYSTISKYSGDNADFIETSPITTESGDRFYLPSGSDGQLIHHKFYSLAYNEKNEQADWVAYVLKKDELKLPNVKRAKRFKPDYDVKTKSAMHKDYSHSGYTRGHMAPAGDMAFSTEAMQESFLMSNMSPQLKECNSGIWKELEENVRDWAIDDKELIVVSGPLFTSPTPKKIGKSKVAVPDAFYKILLDVTKPEVKGIAFRIPNAKSDRHLKEYAVSIDEIEDETHLDFFNLLLDEEEQAVLESSFDISKWRFDNRRFKNRVKN